MSDNMSKFIVMTARAQMPNFYGSTNYLRVALIELDDSGIQPAMISERAKGIKRIIAIHEKCYRGANYPTGRCAASKAYKELTERAAQLSEQEGAQ